ncbi:MAG TPA: thioesterase family protein [Vicinamibacteria bacterium]
MNQTTCQIRVRYAETDGMGVVYYGNYLTWFEVGRTDLLRQLGESYREIEENEGIYLPVVEAHCRYHRPARYDDLVDIVTRASRPSLARVQFDYELSRAEDRILLASGTTLHVAVGRDGRPRRLPRKLRELLE